MPFLTSALSHVFLSASVTFSRIPAGAVSALAWLSPQVLVSGAEDRTLQGWLLKESALGSLWLLPRNQKAVLGLATCQHLLAVQSRLSSVFLL